MIVRVYPRPIVLAVILNQSVSKIARELSIRGTKRVYPIIIGRILETGAGFLKFVQVERLLIHTTCSACIKDLIRAHYKSIMTYCLQENFLKPILTTNINMIINVAKHTQ